MPHQGSDNLQQSPNSESPEQKREKQIDDEIMDFVKLINSIKDRATLRAVAVKEVRSLVREHLLLKERNVALSNQNEELPYQNKTLAMEKEKLEIFARQSLCPNKIRHAIELFPKLFLGSIDGALQRQEELHNKLHDKLQPLSRAKFLIQCVRRFGLLSIKDKIKQEQKFKAIWDRLKTFKDGFTADSLNKYSNCRVPRILLKLYNAENVEDAKIMWYADELAWQSLKEKLADSDVQDLTNLAIPSVSLLAASDNSTEIFEDEREVIYAQDVIKIGYMWKKDVSKYYKLVMWTLYMSTWSEIIKNVLKEIELTYGNTMCRAESTHTFCAAYARLFGIVSELDRHGPGMRVPVQYGPDDADLKKYLDHLFVSAGPDVCFVAKTVFAAK